LVGNRCVRSLRAVPRASFRIWREDIRGTSHYVACRQQPGQHPFAVITPDPGRLRAALQSPPTP
jgi:hypothetical protein